MSLTTTNMKGHKRRCELKTFVPCILCGFNKC
jgi:hypothetical protein